MTTQTQYETVNGIDVGALKRAIADIKANPDAGQTHWTVKSRWEGGTRTDHFVDGFDIGGQAVARQFQIQIDEPCELGGSNQYANPQEYLLAATNACMMVGYSTVAAVMGVKLSKLELEITGDIDLRGFLDIDASVRPGLRTAALHRADRRRWHAGAVREDARGRAADESELLQYRESNRADERLGCRVKRFRPFSRAENHSGAGGQYCNHRC